MEKREAIKNVKGDPKHSYMKLPGFFHMLEETNQGSYIEIKTNIDSNFIYEFITICAYTNTFIKYMRPIIVIYGTLLKKK